MTLWWYLQQIHYGQGSSTSSDRSAANGSLQRNGEPERMAILSGAKRTSRETEDNKVKEKEKMRLIEALSCYINTNMGHNRDTICGRTDQPHHTILITQPITSSQLITFVTNII